MKAYLFLWRGALSEKSIELRITPERERNIQSTDKLRSANQIPNKHPFNEEIKCVDTCAIDAKIELTTLKRAKFAANY